MSPASTRFAVRHPHSDTAEVFNLLGDAVAYCDDLKDSTLLVYRMTPVPPEAMWDWATRKAGTDDEPMVYVHEAAARGCCPNGYEVVRRRVGSSVWLPGDAT